MRINQRPSTDRKSFGGKRLIIAATILLALLAASVAPAAAAPANPGDGDHKALVSRIYRVKHMDPSDAVMLAHQTCLDRRGDEDSCRYSVERQGWFTYNTDAETQEAIAKVLAASDVPVSSLTLRLTLLMADNADHPKPKLAEGEARALADIQQLLPYRSYRLVETGQLLARDRGQIRLGGVPYYNGAFDLRRRPGVDSTTIQFDRFELFRSTPHRDTAAAAGQADDGKEEGDTGDVKTESLLRTSFTMEVGETVIVGTSRLDGDDEALIVLLTATR